MYLKLYFLILITVFILITKSKSDSIQNCSYESTVDLSTSRLLHNNSYLFNNDTLITSDLVHDYNFKILNNGTRIANVKPYKRGCICAIIRCLRFCSIRVVEYLKKFSSPIVDKGFTKNITTTNKKLVEKHLAHDFHLIFGSVCEHKNSKMLAPELLPENKWTLYEDGILRHHLVNRNLTQNEYCFDIKVFDDNTLQFLNPVICTKSEMTKPWIQIYGFVFSIPFFVVIIFLFSFLTNLSNVRGKCFVTYLSLLTVGYTLLSFYKISGLPVRNIPCQIYGYVMYFTTIGVYSWCCILCYDAWTTLTHMAIEQTSFKKYCLIGFSIPLLMTLFKFIANCLTKLPKPLNCIFLNTNPLSVLLFYDVLGLTMVIYSLTLYIMIMRYSWKTKREQLRYFREIQEEQMERLMIYFRVLSLMGFEWIFVFVSHTLRSLYPKNTRIVLIGIYVAYSATILQGPLMFLIFICSSRVRNEFKNKFTKKPCSTRIKLSRTNQPRKNVNVMPLSDMD